jgi:hypothetical protein
MAPRQGKWWNELEGRWVLTSIPQDAKELEGVPDDDSDLLGDVEKEVEQSARLGVDSGEGMCRLSSMWVLCVGSAKRGFDLHSYHLNVFLCSYGDLLLRR